MILATLPFPDFDPVLIHLGPLAIRWYALAYISGPAAGLVADRADDPRQEPVEESALQRQSAGHRRRHRRSGRVGDAWASSWAGASAGCCSTASLLCGVSPDAGAGYCHGLPMDFLTDPIRIIAVWEGGMSFHGAAIGVILAIWLFCRRRKLSLFSVGDLICAVQPDRAVLRPHRQFREWRVVGRSTDVPWAHGVLLAPHPRGQSRHLSGRHRSAPSEPAL